MTTFFEYTSAIGIGFLSSLHCIGMCGPLLAGCFASEQSNKSKLALAAISHHLGRTGVYFMLGAIMGLTGHWLAQSLQVQAVFSIVGGVALVVASAISLGLIARTGIESKLANWFGKILAGPMRLFQGQQSLSGRFLVGALNGLIPCGLVYAMLVKAVTLGNPVHAGVFMAAFGFGTIPALVLFSFGINRLSIKWRAQGTKIAALLVLVMGAVMVQRGWTNMNAEKPADCCSTTGEHLESH